MWKLLALAAALALPAIAAAAPRPSMPVVDPTCHLYAVCPVAGECGQHPEWIRYVWKCP